MTLIALARTVSPLELAWRPYTRLFLVGERKSWSVDHDMRELASIAARLGIRVPDARLLPATRRQSVFYGSQFSLLAGEFPRGPRRIATAYFHGRPGTPGMPEFDRCFATLRAQHERIARVQVTHGEMHELVLSTGIAAGKVFRIRIGIDLAVFRPGGADERAKVRAELGVPESAFLVGSFQKDGVGFGEGLEPKQIKGPDVLVRTFEIARDSIPELHVLLTGPARGYVKAGLERAGVPWVHRLVERHEELAPLYRALDAYVVPSRQEGGPKGVLESMASRVPVVSTRVGQAAELIENGRNGWLVEVEDAEAIAGRLAAVAEGAAGTALLDRARATAEANAYEAQEPLWRAFFEGFVDFG